MSDALIGGCCVSVVVVLLAHFVVRMLNSTRSDIRIQMDVRLPSAYLGMGDSFYIEVDIYEEPSAESHASHIVVEDERSPPYFLLTKGILIANKTAGRSEAQISLKPREAYSRSFSDFPTHLHLNLTDARGMTLVPKRVDFPFHLYGRNLRGDRERNLLLVGFPGVGKTTFCATAISALSPYIKPIPGVGGGDGHSTKKILLYQLQDWVGHEALGELPFNLWDTWGITSESFTPSLIDDLIAGITPAGYKMEAFARNEKTYRSIKRLNASKKTAVLFFLKAAQTQDDGLMQQMKTTLNQVKEHGHSALVVVSWLKELTTNDTAAIRKVVSDHMQIPRNHIFPFHGYIDHSKKDPVIDKNVLEILEFASILSDSYAKATERNEMEAQAFAKQRAQQEYNFQLEEAAKAARISEQQKQMLIEQIDLRLMKHHGKVENSEEDAQRRIAEAERSMWQAWLMALFTCVCLLYFAARSVFVKAKPTLCSDEKVRNLDTSADASRTSSEFSMVEQPGVIAQHVSGDMQGTKEASRAQSEFSMVEEQSVIAQHFNGDMQSTKPQMIAQQFSGDIKN